MPYREIYSIHYKEREANKKKQQQHKRASGYLIACACIKWMKMGLGGTLSASLFSVGDMT